MYEGDRRRAERTGVRIFFGLFLTAVVHAGLVAGAIFLHKDAVAEPEPQFKNLIAAELVKLGEPLPEKALPKLEMAEAPPPPEVGKKFTEEEKVQPEPEKKVKPPPKRSKEIEDELALKLAMNKSTAGKVTDGSRTSKRVGDRSTSYGARDGDPEGISARDRVEGNQWVGQVRRALFNVWDIPTVIPDGDLARLFAIVSVRIDESGNIKSWSMRTRATGSTFAGLFNNSVDSVRHKINQLPPPPPGALKLYPNGIALRFQKQ